MAIPVLVDRDARLKIIRIGTHDTTVDLSLSAVNVIKPGDGSIFIITGDGNGTCPGGASVGGLINI